MNLSNVVSYFQNSEKIAISVAGILAAGCAIHKSYGAFQDEKHRQEKAEVERAKWREEIQQKGISVDETKALTAPAEEVKVRGRSVFLDEQDYRSRIAVLYCLSGRVNSIFLPYL